MQSINLENLLRIVEELELLDKRERAFRRKIDRIYANYKNKRLNYKEFRDEIKRTLSGKTEKEFFEEIKKYRKSLLKTLEHENEKIIFRFHHIEPGILKEMQGKITIQIPKQIPQTVKILEDKEHKAGVEPTKKTAKKEAETKEISEVGEKSEIKTFAERIEVKTKSKIKKEPSRKGIFIHIKEIFSKLLKPAIRVKHPS